MQVWSRKRRVGGIRRPGALAVLVVALCVGEPGHAELSDEQLLPAIIATVIPLDVAIPVGLLPFPLTQLTAEATQFSANLALKAYRPLLNAPAPIFKFPNADGGCSYSFTLPSAQAKYENLFGIIPIRLPLHDAVNNRFVFWNERWGDLGKPARLYHANSSVKVSVASPEALRRWNPDTGSYRRFIDPVSGAETEYYYPIAAGAQTQTVVFPVGINAVSWQASTQLNLLTDVALPSALLTVGVLTEVKNAEVGLKAANKVKQSGIADDVVDQADDAADVAAALTANEKFRVVWKQLLTPAKTGKLSTLVKQALYKQITKIVIDLLCKLIDLGFNVWDQEVAQGLKDDAGLTQKQKFLLTVLARVDKFVVGTDILVLKQLVLGQDKDEIAADVVKFLATSVDTLTGTTGLENLLTSDSATTVESQYVFIYDTRPPHIDAGSEPLILEATDFGGARRNRVIDALRAAIEVSDDCGRQPIVTNDAPELLSLGETAVTWTATDAGPNPNDGKNYAPTAAQTVVVLDTQPPLLLAPPSKVLESDSDISAQAAMIGDALAVDLSDPQPRVTNDAPATFAANRRRQVHWTATDGSGNQAQKTQWITVKSTGSNTPPAAADASAQTLTGQPVDIRLSGHDLDFLDGRFDPLWFKIKARPQHGEFVAPLYPFFIDDYRTRPEDGLGDDYVPGEDVYAYVTHKYCEHGLDPPLNFVFKALFVHVTDDGTHYVLDQSFICDDSENKADSRRRISKWDRDGNLLGQMRFGPAAEDAPMNDAFVLDRDGFLYYTTILEPGSSSAELFLNRCGTDFVGGNSGMDAQASQLCLAAWKFENSSDPRHRLDVRNLSYARVDSQQHLAYITDRAHVFAFRIVDNHAADYLGELGPIEGGAVRDGWLGNGQGMEVDSQGNLYVADSGNHRVHKFGPSSFDQDGHFALSEYVGWAGRCSGSGNKACDEEKQRSKGYSCTYAAESCVSEPPARAGDLQGQFDTPLYLAVDPNDVLYVADYNNYRVQRFSADGSFAGEAASAGTGINKGERPSFVLGNMDKPRSLSVNSSQFFVVDRDEQFVHIFDTLPFKNITDEGVTVTYVSNQAFHGDTDSFTFTVSDGLVESAAATVRIEVSRNFRPPVALAASVSTAEDTPRSITLSGDDPDGIAGKDFNGLDTLTFAVTRGPAHGELTGSGTERTYAPDADFFGEDQIRFTASDGVFTSEEAVVAITVTSVNDPPVLKIDVDEAPAGSSVGVSPPEVGRRAARGFPILLTSTFTDDPSNGYQALLNWGDGAVDGTGEFVDQGDDENPRIEGVAISPPPFSTMVGRTYAEHTYISPGLRPVLLCVADSDGAAGCDSTLISVENLVSLGVGTKILAESMAAGETLPTQIDDGMPFQYQLTVTNGVPSVGAGLAAGDVALEGELPPELAIGSVTTSKGSCTLDDNLVSCALGTLMPGEEVTLTVSVGTPGNLPVDTNMDFSGEVTTTSPALETAMSFFVSTRVAARTTGLCAGDCGEDGMVTVDELVKAVNIALDVLPSSACRASDTNGGGAVTLDELVTALARALGGCT